MNPIKVFISALALLLLVVVGVGFALPGTWQASQSRELGAALDEVFGYVSTVDGWSQWTPMPFVGGERSGPAQGAGATLSWDDPQWGEGSWTLTAVEPPRSMRYEVSVEGGSLRTWGEVTLAPAADGGTLIEWQERGDFGWNPLLSFMALGMSRMQGEEMSKSLDALEALLSAESAPAP